LQNYFRLYRKISGMTGTAETEASEFMGTYKLGVVPIPTNKPMVRIDQTDLIYRDEEAKYRQVVDDIVARHEKGQPVLVGTTSVEKSEKLSGMLAKRGVRHEVLNAKNHAREATIIAQAGRLGAVTVATNMAGRGTDIMLGGNAEFMAVAEMAAKGFDATEKSDEYEAAWDAIYQAMVASVEEDAKTVREQGGLYVLGTERHESRRIDNQLRGRSGRQGDPGESRFYLSLQDDLMRMFNAGAAEALMARSSTDEEDLAIESRVVSRAIQSAQSQVEARNAEIRKNVLKYDDVLNRQRQAIYSDRRHILEGDDIAAQVRQFVDDTLISVINEHTAMGNPSEWDWDALWTELKTLYPIGLTIDEVIAELGMNMDSADLLREIQSDAAVAYERREKELSPAAMRELERRVVLSVIDRRWRDHLYEMDYLKDGIGLRAMAQRDPLVEYQREGFAMFGSMMGQIKEDTTGFVYNLEVQVQQPVAGSMAAQVSAKGLAQSVVPQQGLSYSAPSADGDVEVRNQAGQVVGAPPAKPSAFGVVGSEVPAPRPPAGTPAPKPAQPKTGQPGAAAPGLNRAQRRAKKKR
jgi:preprotein translocase subunit SecA